MRDKNQIKSPKNSGMILIIFFIIGLAVIILSIVNYDWFGSTISDFLLENSPALLVGGLFTILGVLGIIGAIGEMFVKPKEGIVYLHEINSSNLLFADEKGKKYVFFTELTKDIYNVGTYYIALKSPTFLYEIIKPTEQEFEPKEVKDNYWMNCYLPGQEYKNVLMLPVVYLIGLIGLGITIGAKTIAGIPFAGAALYFIIYDYKIKKNLK